MNSIRKKIVFGLLIAILTAQVFFAPQKANALFGEGDIVFDPSVLGQTIADIGIEIARWVEEDAMDFLRDQVAFRIMNKVASDTATWISGGGKPQYVTDWNGFVKDAGQRAFDSTIKEVGLARLCQPFSLQVKNGLLPEKRFTDQIDCRLDDVVRNINNFYTNFENGGWLAYNEIWQPQNNYFGVMILIQDRIQTETSKKVTAATNEAVSGGGFLSQKKCIEYDEKEMQQCISNYNSSAAGSVSESQSSPCATVQADPDEVAATCGSITDPQAKQKCEFDMTTEAMRQCTTAEQSGSDAQARTECQKTVKCAKEEIITPGDTIGKAAAEAITTDSNWAGAIKSWMSMLVNSLINRAMKEGLSAIKGAGSGNRGTSSGGSSATITNLVDTQLIQEQQKMTKDLQKFTAEWQYYLNDKNRAVSYTQQELKILNQINSIKCQPSVSASQITILQTDITRLQTDAAGLQSKINEANKLTTDLKAVKSTAGLVNIQQDYVGFSSKYNTLDFQTALINGSGRAAADAEANKFRQELQDAQNRLSTCAQTGP